MSEQATEAVKQDVVGSISDYIGLKNSESIPTKMAMDLIELTSILSSKNVDSETGVGIFKSYESKFGQSEDKDIRINKFLSFLKSMSSREDIIECIKKMGLYSKSELEEYAKETGDWSHFLRRIDSEKRKK